MKPDSEARLCTISVEKAFQSADKLGIAITRLDGVKPMSNLSKVDVDVEIRYIGSLLPLRGIAGYNDTEYSNIA